MSGSPTDDRLIVKFIGRIRKLRAYVKTALFIVCGLAWISPVFAKRVELYSSPKIPYSDYSRRVLSITKDDVIVFSNGAEYTAIQNPINTGMLDLIVRVSPEMALRIPKRLGGQTTSVEESRKAYETLDELGIDTVKRFMDHYIKDEVLAVEWLDYDMSYKTYLAEFKKLPESVRMHMYEDFVSFAKSTWPLRSIGDQGADQIVYVKKRGWLVLDALSDMSYVSRIQHGTIFTSDNIEFSRDRYSMSHGDFISPYGEKLSFPPVKGAAKRIINEIENLRSLKGIPNTWVCDAIYSIQRLLNFKKPAAQ